MSLLEPPREPNPELDAIIEETCREISEIFAKFAARQEPLGAVFAKVLDDNIEELYEE